MTPCDLVLDALDVVDLIHVLLLGDLVQLCLQHFHRVVAVLELAALGLAADHDAGGLMDESDSGRSLVDVLAAGTGGAVDLHLDVLRADVHLDGVVQLGHDFQRSKAGLTAGVGVKGRDAHQTVDAVLALEQAVGVGTLDHHGSTLHAGLVAVLIIQDLDGHAVSLRPLVVHTVEHLGPVLCLGAASACVEGQDGIAVVVLTVQHGHQLQLVHSLAHSVDGLFGLRHHLGVVLLVQHDQHGLCVIVQALQLLEAVQLALQVAHFVEDLLAQLSVVVEAGAGHGVLQLLHALAGSVDGQRLLQVLYSGVVFSQLYFQFISGDHRFIPLVSKNRSSLFIISHAHGQARLSTTSQSRWRSTAPLVGEPLAKPFTLRGLPKPPLPGEVARRRRDGEVVRRKACLRTRPMTERFTPKRYSLYTDTSLVYPESMIK